MHKVFSEKEVSKGGEEAPSDAEGSNKRYVNSRKEKKKILTRNQSLESNKKIPKVNGVVYSKIGMFRLVKEILQKEKSWFCIQASAILALHKATEAYLMWLSYDSTCALYVPSM